MGPAFELALSARRLRRLVAHCVKVSESEGGK